LLVFAEGTRSRTYGLQPMLAGATRYLDVPDAWVLPVGITGTEALFPVGGETLHSVKTVARFGAPIKASALREKAKDDRRIMMDAIGVAIAELLPPEFHGVYEHGAPDLGEARRLRRDLLEV
jgi:1-acyl-sn-glycerol-3-phosphate acyltransferase